MKPYRLDEFENAKNHLKGSLILSLESSSSRMFSLARSDMTFGRQITTDEILEGISKVTVDDVQRVGRELFDHSNYGTVVVGDLEELVARSCWGIVMKICVLGSGSSGNSTFVEQNGTRLLVDAGLRAKEIVERLALINVDASTLMEF